MEAGDAANQIELTPRSQARCRCREIARPEPFLWAFAAGRVAFGRPFGKPCLPGTQGAHSLGSQTPIKRSRGDGGQLGASDTLHLGGESARGQSGSREVVPGAT